MGKLSFIGEQRKRQLERGGFRTPRNEAEAKDKQKEKTSAAWKPFERIVPIDPEEKEDALEYLRAWMKLKWGKRSDGTPI